MYQTVVEIMPESHQGACLSFRSATGWRLIGVAVLEPRQSGYAGRVSDAQVALYFERKIEPEGGHPHQQGSPIG